MIKLISGVLLLLFAVAVEILGRKIIKQKMVRRSLEVVLALIASLLAKDGWDATKKQLEINKPAISNSQTAVNSPGAIQLQQGQNSQVNIKVNVTNLIKNPSHYFSERINSINDPRIKDGGRISVYADIKDGPIIDIGNKSDLSRNRILVVVENQNQLKLTLLDSNGKKYELQGKFQNASGGGKIECLWSSRYGIIALTYNDEILAQTTLSDLSIFIDSHEQRTIQVAGSLDGKSANGNFKELKIYVLKEMGK